MPGTHLTAPRSASGTTYSVLLSDIRKTIAAGKRRAQAAVERERVRTAWQIGKLILDHVLQNEKRGEYGASVIRRLSKDLEMSPRELRYMVEFARTYQKLPAPADLSWSHYRELLALSNAEKRKAIAEQAAIANWSQKELRREIKKIKKAVASLSGPHTLSRNLLPELKPGKIGTYRIIDWLGTKAYDLGFSIRYKIKGKLPKTTEPAQKDLYHYRAKVLSVYDGDTFHAAIDLGFGIALEQRLRLRALDARELHSRDGEAAQKFLEKILNGKEIIIKTSKDDDQYGRYLVDIFLNGKHINQQLLDSGLYTVRADG